MCTAAGMSDRDIHIDDCNIRHSQNIKGPRTIYNYRKADSDKLKQESSKFRETFLKEYINNDVAKNINKFKQHIKL